MRDAVTVSWPLIDVPVNPRRAGDRPRLKALLLAMAEADPRLHISEEAAGEVRLGADSEQTLDAAMARLDENGIAVECGAPAIAFKETIGRAVEVSYRHRLGSTFLSLTIRAEPLPSLAILTRVVDSDLSARSAATMREIVSDVLTRGAGWGYPVVGMSLRILEADDPSDRGALSRLVTDAARQVLEQGVPVLLEPVMFVRVIVPPDFAASVSAELMKRRAEDLARQAEGPETTVTARTPLINLLGFGNSLRELSAGRGAPQSHLQGYFPVPVDREPPPAAAMAWRA